MTQTTTVPGARRASLDRRGAVRPRLGAGLLAALAAITVNGILL